MSGTYVALNLSEKSANELHQRMELLGVPNLNDANRFHVTVMYSRKEFPTIALELMSFTNFGYEAKITGWDVFDTTQDKDDPDKCLVAKLECPKLMALHAYCVALGGEHTFKPFVPHCTVSYKFNKKFNLERLPVGMSITLDPTMTIEDLKE